MTEAFEFLPRDANLTGAWSGHYWYGPAEPPTPFSVDLLEYDTCIAGVTREPATFGVPGLSEIFAEISGSRSGPDVQFTKIYRIAPGVHRDPIRYTGVLNETFTKIEGEWRFVNSLYPGYFIMNIMARSSGGSPGQAS